MATRLEILKAVSEKFPNTPEGAAAALAHAREVAEFTENDAVTVRWKIEKVIASLWGERNERACITVSKDGLRAEILGEFL